MIMCKKGRTRVEQEKDEDFRMENQVMKRNEEERDCRESNIRNKKIVIERHEQLYK